MSNHTYYKYTKLKYIQDIIKRGIFVSPLQGLNDPYECEGITDIEKYRVVCLTRSINQKLMWSHYADGHRGCLIKITCNCGNIECPLQNVEYSSKIIDRKNMDMDDLEKSLYKKDKKWSSELEVRAVYGDKNKTLPCWKKYRGNIFFQAKVEQIDFGCFSHFDSNYLDALIAIRDYNTNNKKKIKVRKYKMSNKCYRFVLDKNFNYIKEISKYKNGE